jgi:ADP-ribose pyrophosphatase
MDYKTEIVQREPLYRVDRYRLRHTLFEGGWSGEIQRERLEGLRAASVLLYDPVRDCVVLIEQFRIGALESERGAWLLETVGGYVGEGEQPDEVARREVREEAGCEVGKLIPVCSIWVSPGLSAERIALFVGLVDMPADQAIAELYTGRADSTSIVITLQWLAMNREHVRAGSGIAAPEQAH